MLGHVLKKSKAHLFAHPKEPLSLFQSLAFIKLIYKRSSGWPVAYLLGKKEFYGLEFKVNQNVLIPRVDTEVLVEEVIRFLLGYRTANQIQGMSKVLLLDVGTGSGCIAISVLKQIPWLRAMATDISISALTVAKQNAIKHGVENRLTFKRMNLLSGFQTDEFKDQKVIVTANLPYVPVDWTRDESTLKEPDQALFAKDKGLFLYKQLIEQVEVIKPKRLFLEMFEFQLNELKKSSLNYRFVRQKCMTGEARLAVLERWKS